MTVVALLAFGSSCKEKLGFNIDRNFTTAEFTINAGTAAGTVKDTTKISYDLSKIASDNGADVSKFKSLKLKSLKAVSTNGKTYDAFTKAFIALEADGQPKKTIVVKDPVNGSGQSEINFDVDPSLDLLPYFKASNLIIHFEGETNAEIKEDNNTKLELTYTIEVGA